MRNKANKRMLKDTQVLMTVPEKKEQKSNLTCWFEDECS